MELIGLTILPDIKNIVKNLTYFSNIKNNDNEGWEFNGTGVADKMYDCAGRKMVSPAKSGTSFDGPRAYMRKIENLPTHVGLRVSGKFHLLEYFRAAGKFNVNIGTNLVYTRYVNHDAN